MTYKCPLAGLKLPSKPSSYMKFEQGDNKFRILSAPIMGWEDWTPEPDRRPIRTREKPEDPLSPDDLRFFFAFIVWNYNAKAIQILELTQSTIQNRLIELTGDADFGPTPMYDIKVNRSGGGSKGPTKYTVTPLSRSKVDPLIVKAFKAKPIYLDAFFDSKDPFKPSEYGELTQGVFLDVGAPSAFEMPAKVEAVGNDIEHFMDYMPEEATRDSVEECVKAFAKRCKMTVAEYIEKALAVPADLDKFISFYKKRMELQAAPA